MRIATTIEPDQQVLPGTITEWIIFLFKFLNKNIPSEETHLSGLLPPVVRLDKIL
jgi:hypothetical protein